MLTITNREEVVRKLCSELSHPTAARISVLVGAVEVGHLFVERGDGDQKATLVFSPQDPERENWPVIKNIIIRLSKEETAIENILDIFQKKWSDKLEKNI